MNVYFIPGMGADRRIFAQVRLEDQFQPHFIQWIEPEEQEGLQHYSVRLAGGIDTRQPFILIGLSLGGLVATEIAKITHPRQTIIISSVPASDQLPPYFSVAASLHLHQLVHPVAGKIISTFRHCLFTSGPHNRVSMGRLIWDADNRFIKWATNAVLNWKNSVIPENLVHIHGTRDNIFPLKHAKPDYVLTGGHLLTVYQAGHLNELLSKILRSDTIVSN